MTTTDLAHLNVDINVAGPSDYVDNAGPGLLPEGTYVVNLVEFEPGVDPVTGEFRNYINMRRMRVVEGEYEGRFLNDIRIWTTPFMRNGIKVSMLGDFLRGIDASREWDGLEGADEILRYAVDTKTPIKLKINWEAFDRAGFEQLGGLRLVKKSPEEKALRKQCTTKGMRLFPQLPDGSYRTSTPGKASGEQIEARIAIDRVYPR